MIPTLFCEPGIVLAQRLNEIQPYSRNILKGLKVLYIEVAMC